MSTALHWFRRDLRLCDNPGVEKACKSNKVIFLYILDEATEQRPLGGAQKVFLHHTLSALQQKLRAQGQSLILRRGNPQKILQELCATAKVDTLTWNRLYDQPSINRDTKIKETLKQRGVCVESFNASLLYEPWEVLKDDGSYYKVFTPFWKNARAKGNPRLPLPHPKIPKQASPDIHSENIDDWGLIPHSPSWAGEIELYWEYGEDASQKKLNLFLKGAIKSYKNDRNFPAFKATSELSPHLHFGSISPHLCFHGVYKTAQNPEGADAQHFLSELGWREFCHTILYYNPDLAIKNFQTKFDAFPWDKNDSALLSWKKGQTGYPIVDAGMRELWHIGWMHNRVRMITASFLIKNLMIDWREGEKWFWDTLVDADHANNPAGWQWVAGSGTDAAPFFRIFNPVTQGEKFDPEGQYIKKWIPELSALPAKYIHKPWEAPENALKQAEVQLGETYPHPIINHASARERALNAFKSLS